MYNPIISCSLSHIIVPKYCYVGASLINFFSKTWGPKIILWGLQMSISDQCYFYAKYDKNESTRACFLTFLMEQNKLPIARV